MIRSPFALLPLLFLLVACGSKAPPSATVTPPPSIKQASVKKAGPFHPVDWVEIKGWGQGSPAAALATFRKSCRAIGSKPKWHEVCEEVADIESGDEQLARQFFEQHFQPFQVLNEDGTSDGLITGYYGPEMPGSRVQTERFKYPIYGQPEDLLTIDLGAVYPELRNYRLRGRVVDKRVVPYFDRGEIDNGEDPLAGNEIFWVEDPVELFFLHVQGSGRLRLPDGESVMVGYANQNGHRYHSIGRLLLERGAMTRNQMSMQNIRRWVLDNPQAGKKLLSENPSYIFFRELAPKFQSPPGSLGIPLTAERSLAVDRRTIPLGAPVFLSTSWPGIDVPLRRLMVAQDTGGAIKGRVRADFFWGMGENAGRMAGRMKQKGKMWVLLPKPSEEQSSVVSVKTGGIDMF